MQRSKGIAMMTLITVGVGVAFAAIVGAGVTGNLPGIGGIAEGQVGSADDAVNDTQAGLDEDLPGEEHPDGGPNPDLDIPVDIDDPEGSTPEIPQSCSGIHFCVFPSADQSACTVDPSEFPEIRNQMCTSGSDPALEYCCIRETCSEGGGQCMQTSEVESQDNYEPLPGYSYACPDQGMTCAHQVESGGGDDPGGGDPELPECARRAQNDQRAHTYESAEGDKLKLATDAQMINHQGAVISMSDTGAIINYRMQFAEGITKWDGQRGSLTLWVASPDCNTYFYVRDASNYYPGIRAVQWSTDAWFGSTPSVYMQNTDQHGQEFMWNVIEENGAVVAVLDTNQFPGNPTNHDLMYVEYFEPGNVWRDDLRIQ